MFDVKATLRRCPRWSLFAAMIGQAFGCYRAPDMTIEEQRHGHVVMLPGVEGNEWQLAGTIDGLRDAGLDQGIDVIPWGTPHFHSLQNLSDIDANMKRARERATHLAKLKRDHPDTPLTLIGFSGGGGLAILTIEALPEDVMIDRVILIAAAISKDYDLDKVYAHCNDKVINFYSRQDGIVGFGTSLFGTIDRKRTISAGHSGFLDQKGDLLKHEKLQQIAWEPTWRRFGHGGGHIGYLARPWACHVLAPQIDPSLNQLALAH